MNNDNVCTQLQYLLISSAQLCFNGDIFVTNKLRSIVLFNITKEAKQISHRQIIINVSDQVNLS